MQIVPQWKRNAQANAAITDADRKIAIKMMKQFRDNGYRLPPEQPSQQQMLIDEINEVPF